MRSLSKKNMRTPLFSVVLCALTIPVSLAQNRFEGGIRGGVTLTHGYTTVPAITIPRVGSVPELNNRTNGIGTGYSAGLWVRRNFNRFFVQTGVDYNRFVLPQKTDFTVSAGTAAFLSGLSVPPQIPNQTPVGINLISESVLESVNIPVLVGKTWLGERLRAFAGPGLLVTAKAQVKQNTTARLAGLAIEAPETTTDLANPDPGNPLASTLKISPVTYTLEAGVGYTFLRRFDLDIRYMLPVGGIYNDANISGYIGMGTVTLGIRLF